MSLVNKFELNLYICTMLFVRRRWFFLCHVPCPWRFLISVFFSFQSYFTSVFWCVCVWINFVCRMMIVFFLDVIICFSKGCYAECEFWILNFRASEFRKENYCSGQFILTNRYFPCILSAKDEFINTDFEEYMNPLSRGSAFPLGTAFCSLCQWHAYAYTFYNYDFKALKWHELTVASLL